jgi:hypothetical protein
MYGGDPGDRMYYCKEHAAKNGLLHRIDWTAVRARNALAATEAAHD